jgi:hypothetical protein
MSGDGAWDRLLTATEGGSVIATSKGLQSFRLNSNEDLKAVAALGLGVLSLRVFQKRAASVSIGFRLNFQDIFLSICDETIQNWIKSELLPKFWDHLSNFRAEAEENGGSQVFRDWLVDSLTAATETTTVALREPQQLLEYIAAAVGSQNVLQPLTHWFGIHASVCLPEARCDSAAPFCSSLSRLFLLG